MRVTQKEIEIYIIRHDNSILALQVQIHAASRNQLEFMQVGGCLCVSEGEVGRKGAHFLDQQSLSLFRRVGNQTNICGVS